MDLVPFWGPSFPTLAPFAGRPIPGQAARSLSTCPLPSAAETSHFLICSSELSFLASDSPPVHVLLPFPLLRCQQPRFPGPPVPPVLTPRSRCARTSQTRLENALEC